MDINKLFELGTEYFSDYFQIFISTLQKPSLRFNPVTIAPKDLSISTTYKGTRLNPNLFGFLVISIFIGTVLSYMALGNLESSNLVGVTVAMISVWIIYSSFIHGVCMILGGRGTYLETLSVNLQLLAVTYVISSFITLVWVTIAKILPPESHVLIESQSKYLASFVFIPTTFYFVIHSLLISIYIPLALKYVHGFKSLRLTITALASVIASLSIASIFSITSRSSSIATTSIYASSIPTVGYSQNTTTPNIAPTNPSPIAAPLLDIFRDVENGESFESFSKGIFTTSPIDDCAMQGLYGLRISYDFTNGGWGVFGIVWGKSPNNFFDASRFKSLSFWVKGKSGGENFRVSLDDKAYADDGHETAATVNLKMLVGISSHKWTQVILPLGTFTNTNLKAIKTLSFVFEDGSGILCMDNIEFIP